MNKLGIVLIIAAICAVAVVVEAGMYCEAVMTANDYEAKYKTVEDIKELLFQTDNVSIGSGLEAIDLKVRLGDAIVERNNLERDINNWLDCPFLWHKEIFENVL